MQTAITTKLQESLKVYGLIMSLVLVPATDHELLLLTLTAKLTPYLPYSLVCVQGVMYTFDVYYTHTGEQFDSNVAFHVIMLKSDVIGHALLTTHSVTVDRSMAGTLYNIVALSNLFLQPSHLKVINESNMHNVPKGRTWCVCVCVPATYLSWSMILSQVPKLISKWL